MDVGVVLIFCRECFRGFFEFVVLWNFFCAMSKCCLLILQIFFILVFGLKCNLYFIHVCVMSYNYQIFIKFN